MHHHQHRHLHPLQLLVDGNTYSGSGSTNGYHHHTFHPNHQTISPLRLTPREDSTRVQLQRQRLKEQHASVIVTKNIPGLKTSAAFFASLRTNLRLHASPPPSPISTPPSMRGSATSLPPPSPLSQPVDSPMMGPSDPPPAEDPLAGVPELKTYVTTDEEERIAALKLVADGVAQQRQTANSSLITNWLNLTVVVAVMAFVARYMIEERGDTLLAGTTCAGIFMILLAGFRYLTQGYLVAAESINWEWLADADMIVTKFGDEVIGTVIIDWISGEGRQKRKKSWRGEIKGWTVRLRYRKKGVGAALLEEAVKEAKKKGADTIEFAEDHANSKRMLPSIYNGPFDKREQKGRDLLSELLEASPSRGKRRQT